MIYCHIILGSWYPYQDHLHNQIVCLENPAVWYTAEGGTTALDTMLSDLESALIK
ncbi:hypothetical protein lbkm_2641 [Lachnospiraceae bacterium KM106-2]|nr:hypothetical protein lbkm_2641 [Lachnospiraceae bacterium KM106-2]